MATCLCWRNREGQGECYLVLFLNIFHTYLHHIQCSPASDSSLPSKMLCIFLQFKTVAISAASDTKCDVTGVLLLPSSILAYPGTIVLTFSTREHQLQLWVIAMVTTSYYWRTASGFAVELHSSARLGGGRFGVKSGLSTCGGSMHFMCICKSVVLWLSI